MKQSNPKYIGSWSCNNYSSIQLLPLPGLLPSEPTASGALLRARHRNQHNPQNLPAPGLATKTLPALGRQKEHCAVVKDGQLPTQTTLCVSFTYELNHRVLWGEKLAEAVQKICISITTALSTAVIIYGLKRQTIDHLYPSSSILLIWMKPNHSGAMEVLL